MDKITVGVLTISDSCHNKTAIDRSGANLKKMLEEGVVKNCTLFKEDLVPDNKKAIEGVLANWCEEGVNLILTTGGTGISERDVTPEATEAVLEKTIPGISQLMFKTSSEVTPLAALSRSLAGVRQKSLIINLPGSMKGSKECLEAVAEVIPHAIDLITGKKKEIEKVHSSLAKKSSMVECNPVRRNRISPYPCISVSDAQDIVLERIFLLRKATVMEYERALGYILAEDVSSKCDLPEVDVSLKDGYAVISSDETLEKHVIGTSKAGDLPVDQVIPLGSCLRINTGAPLPRGTDAVVEVESTTIQKSTEDQKEEYKITISKRPVKGQDVRRKGSDIKKGQLLLPYRTHLDSSALGVLGAAGVTSVRVFEKPVVAVISTGDELVEPRAGLAPGKVRDSNRITLISLLKEENFETLDLGIAKDEPDALCQALERAFQSADIVVTTGSMSMGERDLLKEVLITDFNAEIHFGRVLMKPGKPTSFATVTYKGQEKFFFGLPGNPASAFVTSHLFLIPALKKISGFEDVLPPSVKVNTQDFPPPLEDRPQYVRATAVYTPSLKWLVKTTGEQRSSRLSSCINANCLLVYPKLPSPTDGTTPSTNPGNTFTTACTTVCSTESQGSLFGVMQSHTNTTYSGNATKFGSGLFGKSTAFTNSSEKQPNFGNSYQFKFVSQNTVNPQENDAIFPTYREVQALLIGKNYFRA